MSYGNDKRDAYEQAGFAMTCRSLREYELMFALRLGSLEQGPVLDAAAGASSFGAAVRKSGMEAVSFDPLYELPPDDMEALGVRELQDVQYKLEKLAHVYDWSYYGSPLAHTEQRVRSFRDFMEDYRRFYGTGSYVAGKLPSLPFADGTFGLVLCSHFLFLYADRLGEAFHRDSLQELLRVCKPGGEVRVYPLLDLSWKPYAGLERLMEVCRESGAQADLLPSGLPFIPGSDHMLRLIKPKNA